jgi:hypothetical protein
MTRSFVAAALALGCTAFNCKGPDRITVPKNDTTAPLIEMTHVDIAGTAQVTPGVVTSNAPVPEIKVKSTAAKCEIPKVMVLGKATNPGGVRRLNVKITTPSGSTVYDATTSQDIAPDNTALPGVNVRGTNGPDGASLDLVYGGKSGCPTPLKFHIAATATNFSGVETKLEYDVTPEGIESKGCICE